MRAERAALAVVAAALLVVGGCGSKEPQPVPAAPAGVQLFGTGGNMFDTLGAGFPDPNAISGMVGTAPLTPLTEDFKQRIRGVDPAVKEYTYAGEAYDAVVITGLAVQLARTSEPLIVAKYINGVTNLGPGGVECTTIKDCLDAMAAGEDIAYRGVAVRGGFTDVGEPSVASYGTLHFGRGDKIDTGKTEFVSAGNADTASKQPAPDPGIGKVKGDPLRLGILLSGSGSLATTSLPIWAGAHLAIKEFNAVGHLGEADHLRRPRAVLPVRALRRVPVRRARRRHHARRRTPDLHHRPRRSVRDRAARRGEREPGQGRGQEGRHRHRDVPARPDRLRADRPGGPRVRPGRDPGRRVRGVGQGDRGPAGGRDQLHPGRLTPTGAARLADAGPEAYGVPVLTRR